MKGVEDKNFDYERGNIEHFLRQTIEALKGQTPIANQIRVEHYFDGIEVPVMGYADYEFENSGIDLKTTLRMPSSMKPEHATQISFYSKCLGKPFDILYVTPKKWERYPLGQNEAAIHLASLERGAHAIRNLLSISDSGEEIARCFAPNTSDFRWSEGTLNQANELWRAA